MSRQFKIEKHWYRTSCSALMFLLLPFSWLFRLLIFIRYFLYRFHFKKTYRFPVPVIVVGNVTVGGTGKTPFVIWLAEILRNQGYRPGIVSRGVGGKKISEPYWVDGMSDPEWVGDEAVLLAKRTHCPLVVCVDRVLAVKELLQKSSCNIVISDDGLQHYRLHRDIEIAIVDGLRELGNGKMLPAGPLREPVKRLKSVDWVVVNGSSQLENSIFKKIKFSRMDLRGDVLISLQTPHEEMLLSAFRNKTAHVVAGIGNPERFFSMLREHRIHVIEHIFQDHYLYRRSDIYFCDNLAVMMTEKDAIKCMKFADRRHWYLKVSAEVDSLAEEKISVLLKQYDFKAK
ncbi:MAG TPA: tetraacyldisaccharide 4'-kinase [Gammaproteobacteria bacterium]|nr:tetraacyldisaccharide 4'-kinase [Gammaproteobacteria bacterium]